MKKVLLLSVCAVIGLFLVSSLAVAGVTAGSGIKLTPHDLSSKTSWGPIYGNSADKLDRICIYCHAPHNTIKSADAAGIDYIPLWNHEVTKQTYAMYSNGVGEPNDAAHASEAENLLVGKNRPGAVSRLCLSCHDATVATNQYGFYSASSSFGGNKMIDGAFIIGGNGDLTNHHPIGFDYQAVKNTDDEIADTGKTMVGSVKISDLLWDGKMECTSCHDVHNTKNTGESFLWTTDNNSDFCQVCHLKNQ